MQTSQKAKTKPTLNPSLRNFWTTAARIRVLYGGRASSKSWDAAGWSVFLATQCRIRVLCARQFQNKIAESVYTLLKQTIERFGLQAEFHITENSIKHRHTGSEFLFYGLWRHIDEIKSLEGIDILWLEEAHNLTLEQWEILEPTIRKEGSQVWILFNPRLTTDFVWRRFVVNTPPNSIKRHINYNENPFLSQTMIDVIAAKKAEDVEEYAHIYGGHPREDDDAVVIKRSWILAAIGARAKLGIAAGGKARLGFDVADGGADANAAVLVEGIEAVEVDEWNAREDELLKSAGRVHALARATGSEIDFDCIGIGAFAGAHFIALNEETGAKVGHFRFNASDGVIDPFGLSDPDDPKSQTNRDYYANLKAQVWWMVARRFRNTFRAVTHGEQFPEDDLISIDPDCDFLDRLIDELATPRRDFDKAGRVKVESKIDMKKRGIPSPNLADAFVMGYAPRRAEASASTGTVTGHY